MPRRPGTLSGLRPAVMSNFIVAAGMYELPRQGPEESVLQRPTLDREGMSYLVIPLSLKMTTGTIDRLTFNLACVSKACPAQVSGLRPAEVSGSMTAARKSGPPGQGSHQEGPQLPSD